MFLSYFQKNKETVVAQWTRTYQTRVEVPVSPLWVTGGAITHLGHLAKVGPVPQKYTQVAWLNGLIGGDRADRMHRTVSKQKPKMQGHSQRGPGGLGPLESKEKILSVSCRSPKYGCVHSKTFKYFFLCIPSGAGAEEGGVACMVSRQPSLTCRTSFPPPHVQFLAMALQKRASLS